jgi:hypothetical protein
MDAHKLAHALSHVSYNTLQQVTALRPAQSESGLWRNDVPRYILREKQSSKKCGHGFQFHSGHRIMCLCAQARAFLSFQET